LSNQTMETMIHPDGRMVVFLEQGIDDKGEYLIVEHRATRQGAMNGPHCHPVLTESFAVKEGRMRFLVDGQEKILGPGGQITIYPTQVHQFWNIGEDQLITIHEIRPPGLHRKMFELVHKLESEGKMNKKGIPLNPLWLGLAWKCMDGYLAGPPPIIQKMFFGGLARLARALGYRI
jgi:quercetin dioxygenase-like cupin family protein